MRICLSVSSAAEDTARHHKPPSSRLVQPSCQHENNWKMRVKRDARTPGCVEEQKRLYGSVCVRECGKVGLLDSNDPFLPGSPLLGIYLTTITSGVAW
jgi:hypothetical protein